MKNIQHIIGITAIGGVKNVGKTRFSLKLANYYAKHEKSVLFLSYNNIQEQSQVFLQKYDTGIDRRLICKSIENFNYCITPNMLETYLLKNHFSTVFIDDFNEFFMSVNDVKKIAQKLHIAFFINIQISVRMPQNERDFLRYFDGSDTPMLKSFAYNIEQEQYIHYCSNIYALHRPFQFNKNKDKNGKSLASLLEMHLMKNNTCNHEKYILNANHYGIFEIEKEF